MELIYRFFGIVIIVGIPTYLHATIKFANIIQAEYPEWIARKGGPSIFYTGMPRIADPNISSAVLGIAFSSRWRVLASPLATTYVKRIRFLLPLVLAAFVAIAITAVIFNP